MPELRVQTADVALIRQALVSAGFAEAAGGRLAESDLGVEATIRPTSEWTATIELADVARAERARERLLLAALRASHALEDEGQPVIAVGTPLDEIPVSVLRDTRKRWDLDAIPRARRRGWTGHGDRRAYAWATFRERLEIGALGLGFALLLALLGLEDLIPVIVAGVIGAGAISAILVYAYDPFTERPLIRRIQRLHPLWLLFGCVVAYAVSRAID